LNITLKRTK